MGRRVLLFITFLLFISFKSIAAVFTVTSNADSGPGTLREALTLAAANGSVEKDYINFNLPDQSEAGRTITITSGLLPNITSNLVIDASSQPGSKLGDGDTKIKITCDRAKLRVPDTVSYLFFIFNASDIEIYGIYFYNFNNVILENTDYFGNGIGLGIENGQNITFGAPGKGNQMRDCDYLIAGNVTSNNHIKLSSNYFDQPFLNGGSSGLDKFDLHCDDLVVGGDTPAEGNHIFSGATISGTNVKIKNNFFGKESINGNGFSALDVEQSKNVEISYNQSLSFRLWMSQTTNFSIYANKDDLSYSQPSIGSITLDRCSDGIVGSEDESLRNIFASNTGNSPDYISSTIVSGSSKNIQVLKNEIICARIAYTIALDASDHVKIPDIKVLINNGTEYSGTASPNSDIYIYYDDSDCPVCSPLKFFQKVKADATGNWKITGNFAGKRWVANALLLSNSSEYTQPFFDLSGYHTEIQPSCGNKNGAITLPDTYYKHMIKIEWYNSKDEKIGEGPSITGLGPGTYYAKGFNGDCFAKSTIFFLNDVSPTIIDVNKVVTQPSCGVGGAIKGLIALNLSQNPSSFKWANKNGDEVGTNIDIDGLQSGEYTLTMTDDVNGCSISYGPIVLKNVAGPNIDQTHPNIQSTNCGQSTGSIKNIIVTGTGNIKYSWLNAQHQEVATTNDLTGQPAGIYTLKVTDDSQCGQVFSSEINIPEINGITLDETQYSKGPTTCNQNNGYIKGITAPGATLYKWINLANNSIAGADINLINVPSGDYQLTVSNTFGCSKMSQVYHIDATPTTTYPIYPSLVQNSCVGQNNGSISLSTNSLVKSLRWIDENNQPAGTGATLTGLKPGKYYVYFTDANGCETIVSQPYIVTEVAPLQIVINSEHRTDDQCGLKTASIKEIQITGGTPPYTYLWTNGTNQEIATSKDIAGIGAGTYTLQVKDAGSCGDVTHWSYYVLNSVNIIGVPEIMPVQLCSPGQVQLLVNSPQAGSSYRLYDAATGTVALDEQTSGTFKINANANSTYYISKVTGSCESDRVKAQITVSLSAIDIPNTFTPNGDGKNDYWNINGAENYPQAIVQVFNRYGLNVFESKGYSKRFDGTMNGKALPAGVYYYIVNLGKSCKLLSGNLTILK